MTVSNAQVVALTLTGYAVAGELMHQAIWAELSGAVPSVLAAAFLVLPLGTYVVSTGLLARRAGSKWMGATALRAGILTFFGYMIMLVVVEGRRRTLDMSCLYCAPWSKIILYLPLYGLAAGLIGAVASVPVGVAARSHRLTSAYSKH